MYGLDYLESGGVGLEIAGHDFVNGVCVKPKPDGSVCGRHLCDIRNVTDEDKDKPDIAHVGNTNQRELDEIKAWREAQNAAFDNALEAVK